MPMLQEVAGDGRDANDGFGGERAAGGQGTRHGFAGFSTGAFGNPRALLSNAALLHQARWADFPSQKTVRGQFVAKSIEAEVDDKLGLSKLHAKCCILDSYRRPFAN